MDREDWLTARPSLYFDLARARAPMTTKQGSRLSKCMVSKIIQRHPCHALVTKVAEMVGQLVEGCSPEFAVEEDL